MRVYVYVDGFNLYYRALDKTPYRWLNVVELAKRVLRPGDTIDLLRYFTARISPRGGDLGAPRRQQIYLSALSTLPNVVIHYGRFLAKTKKRPLASNPSQFVEVLDSEEKGSDVNLASHLINDGWRKRYEAALVLSQDTDLIEPIRIARDEVNLPVGLVWLDGRQPQRELADAASFVRHISAADLRTSQFPNVIKRSTGKQIIKPVEW